MAGMSASERLRALRPEGIVVSGAPYEGYSDRVLITEAQHDAIADVVEAAERAGRYVTDARDSLDEDEMEDGEPSVTAARLMAAEIVLAPALTALREHLEGGDVT